MSVKSNDACGRSSSSWSVLATLHPRAERLSEVVKNVGYSAAAVEQELKKISLGSSPPHLDPAITGVPTRSLTLYRPPPIATY
jgi:hypothetical protein